MEEKRNISVRKIKLSLVCELNDESEIKKYTNEVYDYLRKSIKAQNEAFNILTSEIYFAKKLGKNEANIYYQYSHQAPLETDTNEKQLLEILEMCPVTQEKIDEALLIKAAISIIISSLPRNSGKILIVLFGLHNISCKPSYCTQNNIHLRLNIHPINSNVLLVFS